MALAISKREFFRVETVKGREGGLSRQQFLRVGAARTGSNLVSPGTREVDTEIYRTLDEVATQDAS